jgi:hypothetical protein
MASCFTSIARAIRALVVSSTPMIPRRNTTGASRSTTADDGLDQFVRAIEAIAAIDEERTLPDVLNFDPSKPAKYPNGRVFTDDVIDYRIAFLTKNQCPPSGLKPHTDILKEFPYIGTPHSKSCGT